MPDGGEIFLRFRGDEKEIVTEIEDTGPGIAPEIADKLFQPFATHGKDPGTGLGLSICKKIIEDHQGRIWARNERRRRRHILLSHCHWRNEGGFVKSPQ